MRRYTEQEDGSVACPHRDLTVCPDCTDTDDRLLLVEGVHFLVPDPAERAALRAEFDALLAGGGA